MSYSHEEFVSFKHQTIHQRSLGYKSVTACMKHDSDREIVHKLKKKGYSVFSKLCRHCDFKEKRGK